MSVGRRISNPGRSLAISNFFSGPYFATQRAFLSSDSSSGDNKLSIPMEKLDFAYSRSSGPGGQNVNKLNTKAELRFHVYNADWITADVKARLHVQQANRINNEGELLITAQEHRTQGNNRDSCIKKLKEILTEAFIEPKEREQHEGLSDKNKTIRKIEKRARSAVKKNRGSGGDYD